METSAKLLLERRFVRFYAFLRHPGSQANYCELARRFCALPAFPRTMRPLQHPEIEELVDAVRSAMDGYRPDIVEIIDNPRSHWKWGKRL